MEKSWEEVKVGYSQKGEHTLEFKIEMVDPTQVIDCERLYHLGIRLALNQSKVDPLAKERGKLYFNVDQTVDILKNLYLGSSDVRRINQLYVMLQSELIDDVLEILIKTENLDDRKKYVAEYINSSKNKLSKLVKLKDVESTKNDVSNNKKVLILGLNFMEKYFKYIKQLHLC